MKRFLQMLLIVATVITFNSRLVLSQEMGHGMMEKGQGMGGRGQGMGGMGGMHKKMEELQLHEKMMEGIEDQKQMMTEMRKHMQMMTDMMDQIMRQQEGAPSASGGMSEHH